MASEIEAKDSIVRLECAGQLIPDLFCAASAQFVQQQDARGVIAALGRVKGTLQLHLIERVKPNLLGAWKGSLAGHRYR